MARTGSALLFGALIVALTFAAPGAAQPGDPTPPPTDGLLIPTRSPQLSTLANQPTTVEDVAAALPAGGVCQESTLSLEPGSTAEDEIDNTAFARAYCFEANAGDMVTASLVRTGGSLDPVLLLLDAGGNAVAGSDDADGGPDAYLEYTIAADGPVGASYLLVATRYGGERGGTAGAFALTLSVEKAPETCDVPGQETGLIITAGAPMTGQIDDANWRDVYCFDAEAGDVVRVTMEATSGDLDSFLFVVDATVDVEMARNDDQEGNVYDSQIDALRLIESGRYVIFAERFNQDEGDSRGEYRLTLETLARAEAGVAYLAYNRTNSGSLREDGARDRFLYPGDSENNQAYKAFLTFDLPASWADQGVESAALALTGCRVRGDVFEKLGALVVELYPYGELDVADFAAQGERPLFKLDSCPDAPLDVTEAVRAAAASGAPLQLRLAFTQIDADDQTDDVFIQNQPVLEVRLESAGCETAAFGQGQQIVYGDAVSGALDGETWYQLYCFDAQAGDRVTVTMRHRSGDLDPLIDVFDMTVTEEIAWNDDADGRDSEVVAFRIPAAGQYALFATRFDLENGDTQGDYELTLTLVAPGSAEQVDHVARYLENESGAVSAAGQRFERVLVGDDQTDQPVEGFVSFDLAGLPADAQIAQAMLTLPTCNNGANAFQAFGTLRLERLDYGYLDVDDYGGEGAGDPAALIAEFDAACPDAPLDVTTWVNAARAEGKTWFQLRLVFPGGSDNNDASIVLSLQSQPYLFIDLD